MTESTENPSGSPPSNLPGEVSSSSSSSLSSSSSEEVSQEVTQTMSRAVSRAPQNAQEAHEAVDTEMRAASLFRRHQIASGARGPCTSPAPSSLGDLEMETVVQTVWNMATEAANRVNRDLYDGDPPPPYRRNARGRGRGAGPMVRPTGGSPYAPAPSEMEPNVNMNLRSHPGGDSHPGRLLHPGISSDTMGRLLGAADRVRSDRSDSPEPEAQPPPNPPPYSNVGSNLSMNRNEPLPADVAEPNSSEGSRSSSSDGEFRVDVNSEINIQGHGVVVGVAPVDPVQLTTAIIHMVRTGENPLAEAAGAGNQPQAVPTQSQGHSNPQQSQDASQQSSVPHQAHPVPSQSRPAPPQGHMPPSRTRPEGYLPPPQGHPAQRQENTNHQHTAPNQNGGRASRRRRVTITINTPVIIRGDRNIVGENLAHAVREEAAAAREVAARTYAAQVQAEQAQAAQMAHAGMGVYAGMQGHAQAVQAGRAEQTQAAQAAQTGMGAYIERERQRQAQAAQAGRGGYAGTQGQTQPTGNAPAFFRPQGPVTAMRRPGPPASNNGGFQQGGGRGRGLFAQPTNNSNPSVPRQMPALNLRRPAATPDDDADLYTDSAPPRKKVKSDTTGKPVKEEDKDE